MRITKPPRTEDPRVIQKQQALRGMYTCPSCHSKEVWDRGTMEYTERHLTWLKKWDRAVFKCLECHCQYESDPYNYRAEPAEDIDSWRSLGRLFLFIIGIGLISFGFIVKSPGWPSICGVGLIVLTLCLSYKCKHDYKKHNNFYDDYQPREVIPTVEQTEQAEQTNSSPKSIPSNARFFNKVE